MEELHTLKQQLLEARPAEWEDLPDIALYMDQIISYMPRQLIDGGIDDGLTSAMVNNYIKCGLVPRAEGKRYSPIHIGYLTAVCALKRVMSVRDVGALIGAGRDRRPEPKMLYERFCRALDGALTEAGSGIDVDQPDENLPRLALDLAMRSYANQLACARVMELIQKQNEEAEHKEHKEEK